MGKEKNTDMWVHDLLISANIKHEADGSDIKEINEALKTASKRNTGKVGKPEFICVVKDFLIVIEDKASISKHIKLDKNDVISLEVKDVTDYAVNGAYFYGKHLFDNTSYKKIIAFGVSGNSKKHKITPLFIDGTEYCRILPDVESFISFNEMNIDEYYIKEILKENTNEEKELSEILKDAAILHEDLRNYGNLKDIDKPLIVSGILLALREMEYKNFSVDGLTGDDTKTDGMKICEAIKTNLKRSNVKPETKKDKLLHQFSIIKDTAILNEVNDKLGMTPLKYFTIFLKDKLYDSIRFNNSSEDYLGRFYGEFMSYSGGDGQTLGIVLTPKHITDLFCKLADLKEDDVVLDPCCGTGGFLISAMHEMIQKVKISNMSESNKQNKIKNIKQKQLHGIELQPYMFTIATTNMILRGDGKSNIINENFLSQESGTLQLKQANVGMMNPPYSQGSNQNSNLYELSFAKHLLDSLVKDGKGIIIVPQSCMTGKTEEEASLKEKILEKHTLEGVITLNKDTFYGVGTLPCIAVFTAHQPHPEDKLVKFINFEDDGYKVFPHIGLMETESAIDKKEHLLDVWFDRIDSESKFCVKSTVKPDDEWLHSFYYFNDEIPTKEEFNKTVADYVTFMVNMMSHNRGHLFEGDKDDTKIWHGRGHLFEGDKDDTKIWHGFSLDDLFIICRGNAKNINSKKDEGDISLISAKDNNNGFNKNVIPTSKETIYKNVYTINNNGNGVCLSYYHEYPFIASSDVTILKPKYDKFCNINVALFITTLIRQQKSKFNYGYKMSESRVKKQKILLPLKQKFDETNNAPTIKDIDFEYMINYIDNIITNKIWKCWCLFLSFI